MDTLNRKMFRKKGGGPVGIMASGPELIKRSNGGTFSFGNIPPAISPIPIRQNVQDASEYIFPKLGNQIDVGSSNIIGVEGPSTSQAEQTELERLAGLAQERNPIKEKQKQEAKQKGKLIIDDLSQINQTNENLLKDNVTFPKSESKGLRGSMLQNAFTLDKTGKTSTTPFLQNVEAKMKGYTDQALNAVNELATGNTTAENTELGGMTVAERMEDYVAFTKQKGEEPTLADIKDDAIKLLQFDPDELDQEYNEDREASIWLNMIKSGLAIAAGESDNALTNIAKGFAVGLDGYGQDVRRLRKDLREDKQNAQQTMYTLLKDAKSEALAKRTLEQQQKLGLLEIQRNLIGDNRRKALDIFNKKMAIAKWNVDLLGTLSNLQCKEKELALTEENMNKTFEASLIKAQPDVINLLKSMGHLKLKEGEDGNIQYGQPNYFDQFEMTAEGKKILGNFINNLGKTSTTGFGSEFAKKFNVYKQSGSIGSLTAPTGYANLSEDKKEQFAVAANSLRKQLDASGMTSYDKFQAEYRFAQNMSKQLGIDYKIDFEKLPSSVKKSIQNEQKKTPSAYNDILQY